MSDNKKPLFSGKVAFTLYDTYGFPLDLTQSILREKGIEVDIDEFEKEMAEQKKRAKEAWVGSGDVKHSKIYFDVKEKIQETEFLGYTHNTTTGKILAIIKDGKEVQEVKEGDEFEFFVDKTTFYGEAGGQVGDTGLAIQINEDGVIPLPFSIIEITDTKKPFPHYTLHKGKLESGKLKIGDYVNLSINQERRKKIKANHSSVHLLQYALRQLFGDTIMQKGSYIDEHRLRFDFTYNKQIDKQQLSNIENIVNELIFQDSKVITKIMDLDEAKQAGAIALFNEKYEDKVRVLFMGEKSHTINESIPINDNSIQSVNEGLNLLNNSSLTDTCSIELCGGTHVSRTGEIGLFKIVSEESVSSGVRRIEALTGIEAIKYMNTFQNIVYDIDSIFQVGTNQLVDKVSNFYEDYKQTKKKLDALKKADMANLNFTEEDNGIKYAYSLFKDMNPKDVKGAFIDIQNKKYNTNSVMLGLASFDSKLSILLGISKDLSDKFKANEIIKKLVEIAGGNGGGGQPWFAMGGATDTGNYSIIEKMVKYLKDEIKNQ